VLHVVLAFSIVALAMGVAVVALSILACIRFASAGFRLLAVLLAAALLLMIVDLLKEYDQAVSGGMAARLRPLFAALAAAGHGALADSSIMLAFQVIKRRIAGPGLAAVIVVTVLLAAAGFWSEARPGATAYAAVILGVSVVQGYALVVMGRSLSRIESAHVRQLIRSILLVVPPLLLAIIAQFVAGALGPSPSLLGELPMAQVLYLLVFEGLLLVYGLRYLFRPEPAAACLLPDQFISTFNISPRECEIISMIVQGYSNRMIGEKLYISAMTVKNHIYHIYQKTSAGNKVRLINLINSLK
jgi:DNA-binding CsgD family transcriptional regulator